MQSPIDWLKSKLQLTDEKMIEKLEAGLTDLGVVNLGDMQYVREQDLVSFGVKLIPARRALAEYKQENDQLGSGGSLTKMKDLTINELLAALKNKPNNDELFDELHRRDQYINAHRKTHRLVVLDATKTLDVDKTLAYWKYLQRGHVQREFQGGQVTTLEKSLGRVEKLLYHPVVPGETINEGIDRWGKNWGDDRVSTELMEAVYWARTTSHVLFPKNPDPITVYKELTAKELDERWSQILEDYRAAVQDDEAHVSLVVKESGDRSGRFFPEQLTQQPAPAVQVNVVWKKANLPGELYGRMRRLFLECDEFNNHSSIRDLCVGGELDPFRNSIPEVGSLSSRVDAIIAKFTGDGAVLMSGKMAIVSFVEILAGRYQDARHAKLVGLLAELTVLYTANSQ